MLCYETSADEGVAIALCSSFISQLLLLGSPAATWALFVALHIPDGLIALPGTREAVIQRLLQVRVYPSVVFKLNLGNRAMLVLVACKMLHLCWHVCWHVAAGFTCCHLGTLRGTSYPRWLDCTPGNKGGSNPAAAAGVCHILCYFVCYIMPWFFLS
jgi:hypothetical protein